MLDRNDIETRQHERAEDQAERLYERKLSVFRQDPYSHCEWNIEAFSKYDLLSLALEVMLPDFDERCFDDWSAGPCNRKDILAAIRDSVEKIEL